ncbi:MAG TPA: ABC transporter permease [Candidatus Paceibacterota bacterium]|nr:ABC transporter permease [Candidatus Paceibacterota bacterium]
MHNLRTVILFEFIRAIKKKSFWVSILAIPLLVGVVGGISFLSAQAASNAQEAALQAPLKVAILDQSGIITEVAKKQFSISDIENKEEGISRVKSGVLDEFIIYPEDPTKEPVQIYAKDVGLFNNGKYESFAQKLLRLSAESEITSPVRLAIVNDSSAVTTALITYENGEKAKGFESVIAPGLFLVLFFLLIMLMGNEMLASTTEEKENRVIEMILTTVTSQTLLFGKIISLILLALVRIAVMLVPIIIGFVYFGKGSALPAGWLVNIDLSPGPIAIAAAIFVLAFFLFTGLLVTIGAVMPTGKEAARFFGLVMFSMFIPLYAVQAILSDPSQIIVKVFSFFPTTAPVTLLLRNAAGNLASWETALGLFILTVCMMTVLFSAARAFRYGALEYSRRLSFREIFGKS